MDATAAVEHVKKAIAELEPEERRSLDINLTVDVRVPFWTVCAIAAAASVLTFMVAHYVGYIR